MVKAPQTLKSKLLELTLSLSVAAFGNVCVSETALILDRAGRGRTDMNEGCLSLGLLFQVLVRIPYSRPS